MPRYFVTAKDKGGGARSSVFEASDINKAVSAAQAQGLFVMNVQPMDEDSVKVSRSDQAVKKLAGRKFAHNGIRLEDLVSFARQLATMLESGVPLLRSLSVIGEQIPSRKLSIIVEKIRSDVEQGESFSRSLAKHPDPFGPFWVSLVEVGEASGTLPKVLLKLTSYVEDDARFRGQIISALVYPGVLFFICTAAVIFFALFVGPTFEKVFKEMGTELPALTVFMLAMFNFIKNNILLIIGVIVAAVFVLRAYLKTTVGRWQFEAFVFSLPNVGDIVRLIVIERFTSQMAVLIDTGVPILYAMEISERLVDNNTYAQGIRRVREAVREGKLLADPMEKTGLFPPMAVQMVKVGEETGELGKMLNHVAMYYKQNVEEFMKRISVVIEPVMLVFMGMIIGTIVISMFLPLFNLSG